MIGRMTPYVAQNYIPVPETGCWIWLGAWCDKGYGKLGSHGRNFIWAHRLFYSYHNGPIPDGLIVCHKCDTPACVNPGHLFLGTHADNTADKTAKGRQAKGSIWNRSKIRESDVVAIRQSEMSLSELSRIYGVSRGAISDIRLRKKWKHVTETSNG